MPAIPEAALASVASAAFRAKGPGLPCSEYRRVFNAASLYLNEYLAIEHPAKPEALRAVRAGRLLDALASYPDRDDNRLGELEEGALLFSAASRFDEAARRYRLAAALLPGDSGDRSALEERQAEAELYHGDFFGDAKSLRDSIALFRRLSVQAREDDDPFEYFEYYQWPGLQRNLVEALVLLTEHTADSEARVALLEDAIAIYRGIVDRHEQLSAPEYWARTQYNLGMALMKPVEPDPHRLAEAVVLDAFNDAIAAYSPGKHPEARGLPAFIVHHACIAAALAFRRVIDGRPRDVAPLEWAMAQHGLGLAHGGLARFTQDRTRARPLLRFSIESNRAALEVLTPDESAEVWAQAQYSLGEALLAQISKSVGEDQLQPAIAAFQASQRIHTREANAQLWARANFSVALAHAYAAEHGDQARWPLVRTMAREALATFEAAGSDLDAAYVRAFLEQFATR